MDNFACPQLCHNIRQTLHFVDPDGKRKSSGSKSHWTKSRFGKRGRVPPPRPFGLALVNTRNSFCYRNTETEILPGLIFGNFGQDYSVFGVLIMLLFYVQNCLKWPRTSKTKTETSRTYTAWHKFCKLVGSWSWLSVTSPLNASLICCRKIKQAFRVSQSRPRYLQRKFLGRRLNGFLWLSLNDRTIKIKIKILVRLLDKTVSVG